jgi:(S)-ureidoglycine-glyoxylate aminotransferase
MLNSSESAMSPSVRSVNPPARLLMGPGPINADPRVLRAMSAPLLGQYDPQFRAYMRETQELYRQVFETRNQATLLIDGTARAGIESILVSLIEPGDVVLVPIFGRFGHLLCEIASRCGADVRSIETPWGTVFAQGQIATAIRTHRPKLLAICQGDTSTTMCQPLDWLGPLCREHGVWSYVDATASIGGQPLKVDGWELDAVSVGLQKCLGGPSGVSPITLTDALTERIQTRWHVEAGIRPAGFTPGTGPRIPSNYLDLAMILAYWEQGLNHHTEATSMLYAAHECARILLEEGLDAAFARHALNHRALRAGLQAMGLALFGDAAHSMRNVTGVYIPEGINGEAVRQTLLEDFGIEIGTSFGPLAGVIWRIGTMGYNARKDCVLQTLASLHAALRLHGFRPASDGVLEAHACY